MSDRIGRPPENEPGTISMRDLGNTDAIRKAQLQTIRYETDQRVLRTFRNVEHAKKVWDDWDGVDPIGEDAHWYLNMMGHGKYCAV